MSDLEWEQQQLQMRQPVARRRPHHQRHQQQRCELQIQDKSLSPRSLTELWSGPLGHGTDDNWTWSKRNRSKEVVLSGPNFRTVHFHPNWSKGTAGIQGKRPLNNGRHYWELHVSQRVFGTSIMFGIGTKSCRLHANAFRNMLGENEHGWGLSHKGECSLYENYHIYILKLVQLFLLKAFYGTRAWHFYILSASARIIPHKSAYSSMASRAP